MKFYELTSDQKIAIEDARKHWINTAKKNNWEQDEIFVQVWFDKDGLLVDAVSHKGLTKDYFFCNETDTKLIVETKIVKMANKFYQVDVDLDETCLIENMITLLYRNYCLQKEISLINLGTTDFSEFILEVFEGLEEAGALSFKEIDETSNLKVTGFTIDNNNFEEKVKKDVLVKVKKDKELAEFRSKYWICEHCESTIPHSISPFQYNHEYNEGYSDLCPSCKKEFGF